MSFKMPLKEGKLKVLKASIYVNMLTVLIQKKYKDGLSVPFMIITNHVYANLDESKSAKLPLFLLGDRDTSWKDYHKRKLDNGKTQKEHTIAGICHREGDTLVLEIDGSLGSKKFPPRAKKLIGALLKKINKNLVLSVVASKESEEEPAVAAVPVKKPAPDAQKKVAAYQAKKLNVAVKNVKKAFKESLKIVSKNIKKGVTSIKDIELVKSANSAYNEFCELHDKSAPPIQKKFEAVHKKLTAKKMKLYKISMVTKEKKQGVAERIGNDYFQTRANRNASEGELELINDLIADTLDYNKEESDYKVNQIKLLKITSFVLKKVGIKQYKPEFTDLVLAKVG